MSETVCVTVEQLRKIEWCFGGSSQFYCPNCHSNERYGHVETCWLGNAIALADRRLIAELMPEEGNGNA